MKQIITWLFKNAHFLSFKDILSRPQCKHRMMFVFDLICKVLLYKFILKNITKHENELLVKRKRKSLALVQLAWTEIIKIRKLKRRQ